MWQNIFNCSLAITTFLTVVVFILVHLYLRTVHSYWAKRKVPFEKPRFLVGSLWEVFKGKKQIGKHLGQLYGKFKGNPYFGIYILGKPYLVLRKPEIIKRIAIKDFKNFEDRTFACDKTADEMAGNSLFILRNPEWRNIRNKLSPIFTGGKIRHMIPFMTETAKEMQNYLDNNNGNVLDMKDVAGRFMTDLVAKCFFGLESNSFKRGNMDFRRACVRFFEFSIYRTICLFSYFFVPKLVSIFKLQLFDTDYFKKVFLETLSFRQETGLKRNDFVDLLINIKEHNVNLNFDTTSMVAQAITFLVAGFETTSNLLAFALYELSLRPDCQEKLRSEILKNATGTYEEVQHIKYLDMVISETLRRYPFGPFLNRNCKEDYIIQETGLKIEKNTPILIPLDGIHFDPEFYEEPLKFEPERFRNGYKHLLNTCVYMPFGLGPRNCIGDRFGQIGAKVGLVYFLKHFRVEKCEFTQTPLILDPRTPFMVPIGGLKLKVTKI
ncbi:hypothetical protein ABEB36_006309 [Hypothenemus hampei]|uniref:Cytochrome P450 n=1 Tax=Hypothenemus hampei TaxID=57062 RepID=A0ABD1EQL8_HYPHA